MPTYRTTDDAKWGVGKGSNLTATEIDANFWDLLVRIVALETNPAEPTEIASFSVAGSQMTVNMADGTTHGPFTLPTAVIRFRGDWTAATAYFELDLVTVPGDGLYLVLLDHISGATFDPVATDGSGNLLHRYLLPLTGGALADLADVDLAALPLDDGDALIYDVTTGTWIPGFPAMGLDDLQQVFPGTPADGDVLTWVAADVAWRSRPAKGGSVSDEGVLVLAAPTDLNFTGAGVSVVDDGDGTASIDIPGGAAALSDLTDVDPVAPIDSQVLAFDAVSGLWEPRTISPGEGGVSTTVTPTWHGARAYFTGTSFPTPNSLSTIAFTAVSVDTDALVSGNTFVTPAGVTKVRLRAMMRRQSGTDGNDQIVLVKNGAVLDDHLGGFVDGIPDGYSNNGSGVSSGVLDVVPGDTFQLVGTASSSTPTFDGWFEIEVIEGALLDQVVGGVASVSDDGVQVLSGPTDINFAGPGVSVADDGDGSATVMIDPAFTDLPDTPDAYTAKSLMAVNNAGNALVQPPGITVDETTGYIKSTAGGSFKKAMVAMTGEGHVDYGMTGLYDRDTLVHADKRATITVNITGAGAVSGGAGVEHLFDASGDYFSLSGTDATTTGFEIVIEFPANEPLYGLIAKQPYVQTRLTASPGFVATWYASITVELSPDGVTWYKPAGGEYETADFYADGEAENGVVGLWMGTPANPGIPTPFNYRFVRFTFDDRRENASYAFKDQVWLAEIGLRNLNAPYARQFVSARGGTVYGGLDMMGATGGNQGDGTINATAVYDDGSLLCAPIVEAVSGSYDRSAWEALAPNGGVDRHEALKASGFVPGSADSYAAQVEAHQGIPGYWNRAEWETRLGRRKARTVVEFGGEETTVMVADRVSLAEREERLLLALDYAALAIRDLTQRVRTLEASAGASLNP